MNVGNCTTIERLASVINSCRHRALRSGTQRVRSASLFTGSCACMPELASPLASVNRSGRDAGVGEGASCWSLTSAVGEEYRGPDRVHLARRALQPGIASSCVQVCVWWWWQGQWVVGGALSQLLAWTQEPVVKRLDLSAKHFFVVW